MNILDFGTDDNLGFPVRELPEISEQKRKRQATRSWPEWKIVGADTETVEGCVWLFATEFGVWEPKTFADIVDICSLRVHVSKWKKSKATKNGAKRGFSPKEFFFYNLQFDVQAVLKLMSSRAIMGLLKEGKCTINADTGDFLPKVKGRMCKLKYLEGKYFRIQPVDWFIGQYKIGPIQWWDISPFFFKSSLNNAAKQYLGREKLEECFDGSILDASNFDDGEYRDYYAEDIEKYAVIDCELAGELARLTRKNYIANNVRFIQPYSVANVAQRSLLDRCKIPVINPWLENSQTISMLQKALTTYHGGWFETSGAGFVPNCNLVDLTSAYPYTMRFLKDPNQGGWIRSDEEESFYSWLKTKEPFDYGFVEASILFDDDLPWHPLVKKTKAGTLVAPRHIRGWFTAVEIEEALKWPHSDVVLGEHFYHSDPEPIYPFRDFIDHFYEMKMNSVDDPIAYSVAKVMLNSIYGKTIQAVNNKAGKLWNPFWASTITGATRARLAEINRLNDFTALSYATDGVIFKSSDLVTIPERPIPAPHNLGQWEMEMEGDLLSIMSGVYSLRNANKVKTTFRGSSSYFVRSYRDGGLFEFCKDNASKSIVKTHIRRPWSLRESAIRSDLSLINVFERRDFSMTPMGDSNKRMWENHPRVFRDLTERWWESSPHRQIDTVELVAELYD